MGHWVIYEMNIGSFSTEGTFNAATLRLPDLKELGIDIIWLMPIYVRGGYCSGGINTPYASKNMAEINPNYGTLSDLKNFVNKAHELNMRVWLDWIPAHTANCHPWLTDHRDYYVDDEHLHQYYGDVSQLNYENSELRTAMNNILKYWIDEADIDGYRVDFISCDYVTNDYWETTIPELKNYKSGKTITFLGEADFTDKSRFYKLEWDYDYAWWFQDTALHQTMKDNPTDAGKLKYLCDYYVYDERYSTLNRMIYLTNHDVNGNHGIYGKLSSMYGDNKYIFTVLYFTFYGMPLIYNGQEIGCDQVLNYYSDSKIDWTSPDNKMLNTIKTLTALKHSEKAVQDGKNKDERGKIIWLTEYGTVAAYIRRTEKREALIVLNLGEEIHVTINGVTPGTYIQWIDSWTISTQISRKTVELASSPNIHLERKGYAVFVLQGD
jgi:1,4-alpha-glucan branching enzyme